MEIILDITVTHPQGADVGISQEDPLSRFENSGNSSNSLTGLS